MSMPVDRQGEQEIYEVVLATREARQSALDYANSPRHVCCGNYELWFRRRTILCCNDTHRAGWVPDECIATNSRGEHQY